MYNMDVDAAINKQEENVANKKSKIEENTAQDLGHAVPQNTPFFPSSSSSSASTAAPSSSAGAASSSLSTVQNMIVDRPDGVKRNNDHNSSKPKKVAKKRWRFKFHKKRKALL